jgi:oligopeptide transport system substrate-binding protein
VQSVQTIRNFILFMMMTLIGGCSSSNQPTGLRLQLTSEPVTLDFSLVEDGVGLRVLAPLMVGLVSYDQNYKLKYEIAQNMEKLDGGRRYRFKLKEWKWSDGKTVTAHEFIYAFRRTLDPAVPAKLADLLFFIQGAKDFKKGKLKDFSKVGVRAISDREIEFVLEGPYGFFPSILTLPLGYPQRQDVVERFGVTWPEHMVTTGAYTIARWTHDQSIELEKNPQYIDFPNAAPYRATFLIIPEDAAALNLFENNRLDVLFRVPPFDLERLRKRGLVREFPYFATYYLGFDQRKAPWNDRRARLAVAHTVDRDAIVQAINTSDEPATSWIARGIPGFNSDIGVDHSVAKAKREWGNSIGRSLRDTVASFDSGSRNQIIMERVQAELKNVLNLNITLHSLEWKTYVRTLSMATPPMFRFGWLVPFVDPYASLMVFKSNNPNNYTGWKNARYDRLVDQIAALDPGSPQRQGLINQAQHLLLNESVVVVPLFHYSQSVAVSAHVKNLWINGIGTIDLLGIELTP